MIVVEGSSAGWAYCPKMRNGEDHPAHVVKMYPTVRAGWLPKWCLGRGPHAGRVLEPGSPEFAAVMEIPDDEETRAAHVEMYRDLGTRTREALEHGYVGWEHLVTRESQS